MAGGQSPQTVDVLHDILNPLSETSCSDALAFGQTLRSFTVDSILHS